MGVCFNYYAMINGCYKQYSLQLHEEIITLCCKERKDSLHFRHRMFSFDTVLHLSVNAAADQKRRQETGASRSSHRSLYVISNCRPTCECKHPEVAWEKDIWLLLKRGCMVHLSTESILTTADVSQICTFSEKRPSRIILWCNKRLLVKLPTATI